MRAYVRIGVAPHWSLVTNGDVNSLAVGIPTITAQDLLDRCLASVGAQECVRPDILVIQNGPKVEHTCRGRQNRGVTVHRPGRNLGVTASWNYGCRWAWSRGHDAILLLNDDLALSDPHTLSQLRASVESNARALHFLAGRGFGAVCMPKAVWDEVGELDEGFWPWSRCPAHGVVDATGTAW